MKKIFLSILATAIVASVSVYAEGGKKITKKATHKKERKKTICPNRPGCICH